jgi:hypothetical protein
MSKTAVVVYSDPKAGSDEALGRLFNALFVVYELQEKKQEVALDAGVRWAAEVVNPKHPAHPLYQAVKDHVVGVCGGCADVFGATGEVKASGLPLVNEKAIPGTSGIVDLSKYLDQG